MLSDTYFETPSSRSLAPAQARGLPAPGALRCAGLMEPHRKGRMVYYRVSSRGGHLLGLFGELDDEGAPPDRAGAPGPCSIVPPCTW